MHLSVQTAPPPLRRESLRTTLTTDPLSAV